MKKPLGNQVAFLKSSEMIQALCARQFAKETPPKANAADTQAKGRQRIIDGFRHGGNLEIVKSREADAARVYGISEEYSARQGRTCGIEIHRVDRP
jgi:hypothetical protein